MGKTNKEEAMDQLTPEQQAKIPEYVERFNKMSLSCGQTDRAAAEAAIKRLYAYMNKVESRYSPNPEIEWADGVFAGAKLSAQHAKGDVNVTPEEIHAQADSASFGSFEAYWVSTYSFIANEMNVKKDELIDIVEEIVTHCGVFWTFEDLVVMTPKPEVISVVDGKISNTQGPAIKWPNGEAIYAFNGDHKSNLMEVALAQRASETKKLEDEVSGSTKFAEETDED